MPFNIRDYRDKLLQLKIAIFELNDEDDKRRCYLSLMVLVGEAWFLTEANYLSTNTKTVLETLFEEQLDEMEKELLSKKT